MVRRYFFKGYSWELLILVNGVLVGLLCVYDIVQEEIVYGDGWVDLESFYCFVVVYQKVVDFKLGELWVILIMLCFVLIENFCWVGVCVVVGMIDCNEVDIWVDQMIDVVENDLKSLILVIVDMVWVNLLLVNFFVVELVCCLQGYSLVLVLLFIWIEQCLFEFGYIIE